MDRDRYSAKRMGERGTHSLGKRLGDTGDWRAIAEHDIQFYRERFRLQPYVNSLMRPGRREQRPLRRGGGLRQPYDAIAGERGMRRNTRDRTRQHFDTPGWKVILCRVCHSSIGCTAHHDMVYCPLSVFYREALGNAEEVPLPWQNVRSAASM
jgi:hypothetical protein